MSGLIQNFFDTFWAESVWLPPNTTWADIAPGSRPGVNHANYRHLFYPLPMALVMLGIRYLLERFWFSPIGVSIGIRNSRPKRAPPNAILEKAYNTTGRFRHKQIQGLAKQLDWTERQVERWLRLRKSQDKPSTLVKFCENSWRCLYYTCSFFYGLLILWDKPWLWDINRCWDDYPHQSVTDDLWWYYMVSLSFYWSLCVSQFFDVRRKDFWQMFVHHIATITLMGLSWTCNLYRIGSLVLVVHDCADIFLEAGCCGLLLELEFIHFGLFISKFNCILINNKYNYQFYVNYLNWLRLQIIRGIFDYNYNDFCFCFSTSVDATKLVPMFPAYYIFNSLLVLLLILHIFWTFLILKIAYKALNAGKMEGDIRSSSSACSASSHSN